MTLPASSQIAMSQINSELGRSAGSLISINSASNGLYATINIYSPSRPNSSDPESMSEWYSYNHSATTTTTTTTTTAPCYNLGTVNYYPNGSIGAGCCNFSSTATLYSNCSSLGVNCYVYASSNCTSPVNGYAMTTDFSTAYFAESSGQISYSQACYC
jgi:hypothetical protein